MLKQPKRANENAISNLATGSKLQGDKLKIAALLTVAPDGEIEINPSGFFLLNPTSWQESKSANWAEQNIPGQSDPILQWISSGARTVTFEALVTAETADLVSGQGKKPGAAPSPSNNIVKNVVGFLAAKFAKTAPPAPKKQDPESLGTNLDISNYLNYYRSLLYPVYENNRLKSSPPLLTLYAGTAINRLEMGGMGTKVSSNHDLWVLTDLQINITKQLPNLAPLEATVTFKLVQYNIRSFDRYRFTKVDM